MIGKRVHVTIDRPLGSAHPKHKDMIYKVNYGYISGIMGGDGEEQDVYVLGVDHPICEFDGVVIAIIQRRDDNETKWIVAPEGTCFSDEEILRKIHFQEKYFSIAIIRD